MRRVVISICLSLGAWAGWSLGYHLSIWVALVASAFGSGLSLFLYRRFLDQYM